MDMTSSQSEPLESSSLALICQQGLDWAAMQGIEPYGILWVLPRTELLSEFKANWCKAIVASSLAKCPPKTANTAQTWQGFAPKVLTADRLSQPWAQAEWMQLLSKIVPILQNLPHISGHLSAVALWALADEYVQLAFRLHVLSTSPAGFSPAQHGVFASAEAQVIMVLREHCADVFESWLSPPCFHAQPDELYSPAIQALVWVDDGEPWPKQLLQRWYPQALLLHIPLLAIQGPKPWQRLAERPVQHHWQQAADEASACDWAAAWVLHWLNDVRDDEGPITIVAVDRLLARRLCAILASRGVLVDDRTGWVFSTARVAAWFDALIQAAMGLEGVQTFVHPFQFTVGGEHHTPEHQVLTWPVPWRLGGPDVPGAKYTLQAWASMVLHALDVAGCVHDLDADPAGIALLNGLRAWAGLNPQAMDLETPAMSAHDCWLAWRYAAEQVRFRPQDASSPVRMLPLLSTRLQPNGKVLVLGCAQSHFQQSPPGLLPPSVMSELGLLSPKAARIQKLSALYELLWHAPSVVVHAEHAQGKPQAALPEMVYLTLLCKQPAEKPAFNRLVLKGPPITTTPLHLTTAMNGMAYPEHIRATAFDDWALCGLRFGLKHAMPWPWRKSVQSIYAMQGILVHQWLQEVAFKVSQIKPVGFMACQSVLEESLMQVWKRLNTAQQVAHYLFRQQLQNSIKPVSGVLAERIQEGWHVRAAEERVVGAFNIGGKNIAVTGRVDWVEVRNSEQGQQTCIVDIKWKSKAQVQRLANNPEAALQLPIYQHLMQQPNTQLAYWFLQPNHSAHVPLVSLPAEIQAKGFEHWGAWVHASIQDALQVFFAAQKPWPQNPGDACLYCAVKGICRPVAMADAEDDDQSGMKVDEHAI